MYTKCTSQRAADQQRLFEQVMLDMLKDQLFEDISISELCRRAGLSRKTFYRLYEAKADVIYAMIDHAVMEAECFVPDASVGPGEMHRFLAYWKSRKEFLDVMKSNRISSLLSQQAVLHVMREAPEIVRCLGAEDSVHGRQSLIFYVTGLFSLVLDWHDRDFADSIDEMAAMLMRLMTTPPVKYPLEV